MRKDDVGYGRPPVGTRFQPGQSGNPSGRPKRRRNFFDDLSDQLERLVTVTQDGQRLTVPAQQAIAADLVTQAVAGDGRALAQVVALCLRLDTPTPEVESRPEDDEIVAAFEQSRPDRLRGNKEDAAGPSAGVSDHKAPST